MPRTKTTYEWDVEEIDTESGDIIDHDFRPTLAQCLDSIERFPPKPGRTFVVLLLRYVDDVDHADEDERGYSYVTPGGQLVRFRDAYDTPGARVPRQYVQEMERSRERYLRLAAQGLIGRPANEQGSTSDA